MPKPCKGSAVGQAPGSDDGSHHQPHEVRKRERKMKQNINHTNEILNGYKMINDKLNVDYLADCIILIGENTERTYNQITNTRRKPLNVALEWVLHFINTELEYSGYRGYYATLYHLKAYEKHNDELNEVIYKVAEYITESRKELTAE